MRVLNFTPHPITLIPAEGDPITLPSVGLARVKADTATVGSVGGIPIVFQRLGEVMGIGSPAAETVYVVSRMVAAALPHRGDVLVPADLVRDDQGQIVGCRALERLTLTATSSAPTPPVGMWLAVLLHLPKPVLPSMVSP